MSGYLHLMRMGEAANDIREALSIWSIYLFLSYNMLQILVLPATVLMSLNGLGDITAHCS